MSDKKTPNYFFKGKKVYIKYTLSPLTSLVSFEKDGSRKFKVNLNELEETKN